MPINDKLITIVEDYISDKCNGNFTNKAVYEQRIKLLKKSDEEVTEIMFEIEHDCEIEVKEQFGLKKAKTRLILFAIIGLTLSVISIISALGYLFQDKTTVFFYGGVAASIIFFSQNLTKIKNVNKRKKRRALKWRNWN